MDRTDGEISPNMKTCTKCLETKPEDLFSRHSGRGRKGRNSQCKACCYLYSQTDAAKATRARYAKSDKCKATVARHRQTDAGKRYRLSEKGRIVARRAVARHNKTENGRLTYARGLEKHKQTAKYRETVERYRKAHLSEKAEAQMARKSAQLKATPQWANRDAMKEFYRKARDLILQSSLDWHVDHIVPLKSKLVCGLHVEHNLQVMRGKENIRKGNRQWPDMPNG